MNKRIFDLAKKIAPLSNHKSHKLAAILLKNGYIQSFGVNQLKTHTKSPSPFKTVHAEFDAIIKSKLDDFEDCEMYIYRQTKGKGILANAKPCKYCYDMLKSLGISKIHYTIDGSYKSENL